MFPRTLLTRAAAVAGAAVLPLAMAALPAGAGVVQTGYTCFIPGGGANNCGNVSNPSVATVAGYQVFGNGSTAYNDVRATFHTPSSSDVNANFALILQARANVGGQTDELALVHNTAACAHEWQLEAGNSVNPGPGPIPFASLSTALIGGTVICVGPSSSFYLEVYYSTKLHTASFLAGPLEFVNVNDLGHINIGFHQFHSPAIGVHYTDPALPTQTETLLSLTRVGLTKLLCPTCSAGGTNGRITFSHQSLQQVDALANATSTVPINSDPVFMSPTGFGSGSSFAVNAVP